MALSPEQIKQEFAARRLRQILISSLSMAPVLFIAFLARIHPQPTDPWFGIPFRLWLYVAFGMILAGIGLSMVNWRCPACGAGLSRSLNHPYCSKCGVALQ